MQFTPSFLDDLRGRIGLAELIGRRVRLQKRGREFIGLCPFHNEKSPSFAVVEEKGFFHCFGCGAHGDAIGFVMRAESLSFPEAVERLASEAGMPLPVFDPHERAREQRRATVSQAIEAACAWFEGQLYKPVGKAGLDYLRRRGLDDEIIAQFRLGFAPGGGTVLRAALNQQGIDDARLLEAGLLVPAEDGRPSRDFFRERVMFPIADRRGRVIAFGARALGDEKPKYLNSRDNDLFHKGRTLYNLAKARAVAADTGTLVVAEGYMDVIAFHQAGIGSGVAPLGTALTEDQLGLLWKIVPEPIVCLDGDAAGLRAALRAAERALPLIGAGRSLRFALLPEGEDPDSLLRAQGPVALKAALERTLPLAELLWRATTADQPVDTPERKAGLRQALMGRANQIADPVVREYYRREFAERFQQSIAPPPRAKGERWTPRPGPVRRPSSGLLRRYDVNPTERRERVMLAALVNRPELLAYVAEELAQLDFSNARLDSLRRQLVDIARAGLAAESDHDRGNIDTPGENPRESEGQTLDVDGLRRHLEQSGFATLLEGLSGREVASLGSFIRPDTPLPAAIEVWKRVHDAHRLPEIERELARAAQQPEVTTTTAGEARLLRLRADLERARRAAASLD